MDFRSHTVNRSELEAGDHIYVYRTWGYSHHGIYVGGDKVVHFGLNSNNSSSIFSSSVSSSSGGGSGGGGRVVMTCLNCFLESGSLRRYQYEVSALAFTVKRDGCTTLKSDPPRTVTARALYLLRNGFREYDLLANNCEHFALYCKTGIIVGRETIPFGQAQTVVSGLTTPGLGTLVRLGSALTAPCASADTMDFGTVDILSAAELQGIACASCL